MRLRKRWWDLLISSGLLLKEENIWLQRVRENVYQMKTMRKLHSFFFIHNIIVSCVLLVWKKRSVGSKSVEDTRQFGLGWQLKLDPDLSGADRGPGSHGMPLSLCTNKQSGPGVKLHTDHLCSLNTHIHPFYPTRFHFQLFLFFDVDHNLTGAAKCF